MEQALVVEDETDLRSAICRDLARQVGLSVRSAGAVGEALPLLADESLSVLVSDLDLPDGTGLDLLPELAMRGRNIPVIFITGHYPKFADELPSSPNIYVLQKPFPNDQLCTLVRKRLERFRSEPPPPSVFTVTEYLQLAGMARRSLSLEITGAGASGRIVIVEGQVRWAGDQRGEGIDAFRRLALLTKADVRGRPVSHHEGPANISGSLDQLLLDAVRLSDEKAAGLGAGEAQAPKPGPSAEAKVPEPPPSTARSGKPSVGLPRPNPATMDSEALSMLAPRGESGAGLPARATRTAKTQSAAPAPEAQAAAGEKPPAKAKEERTVNQPKSQKPKLRVEQLLSNVSGLKGVARAARDGSVLDCAGDMDAETLCAVASLAGRQIDSVAAELGLGDLSAWQLSTKSASWYVVNDREDAVVALGDANRNPTAILKKIANDVGR